MIRRALTPLTKLFKNKTEIAIFLSAFLIEIGFGLYLVHRWGFTFSCFDDVLHIYKARVVVDNGSQSGLANLGVVWLPLFQILLMPLVLIDPLYTTGFAGTIVNALATGGICVTLYKMFRDRGTKLVAMILFLSNGFTIIYGSAPMNEQLVFLFLVLGAYYFKRYWEKDDVAEFIKCSLVLILGTLTRYEVWPATFLAVLFFIVREQKNGKSYRLAYAHLPLWGIFAWLFWNLAIFRDPLMFINHPMGTRSQTFAMPLSYAGSFGLTILQTITELGNISGFLWLVSTLSLLMLLFLRRTSKIVSSLFLMSPIGMHIIFAYAHLSPMLTRYFYMGYIGLIVTPLFLFEECHGKGNKRWVHFYKRGVKIAKVIFVVALFSSLALTYPFQINIIQTGIHPGVLNTPWARDDIAIAHVEGAGEEVLEIKNVLSQSSILVPCTSEVSAQLSIFAGISPSVIFDPYDDPIYAQTMESPWEHYQYVIIKKTNEGYDAIVASWNDYYKSLHGTRYYEYLYYNDPEWRTLFLDHYGFVLETSRFLVFKRVV